MTTHTHTHVSTQKGTSCVHVQPAGVLPGLPGWRRDFLQLSRVVPALLDHHADISSPRSDVPLSLSLSLLLSFPLANTHLLSCGDSSAASPSSSVAATRPVYQHAAQAAERGNSFDKVKSTVGAAVETGGWESPVSAKVPGRHKTPAAFQSHWRRREKPNVALR